MNMNMNSDFDTQAFNTYVDELLNIPSYGGWSYKNVKRNVEYVNILLQDHANNHEALAIIDTLFQRVNEKYEYLKNKRIDLRDRLLILFKEGFTNTYDMYDEHDDNDEDPYGRFKLDIHVHNPLERQTNERFEEFYDARMLSLESTLFRIIDLSRTIYTYCVRYLNKLTTQINYVKGQIFKYELARRDQLFNDSNRCQVSLALDVILNTEFMKFYELKENLSKWNNELNSVSVDSDFMSQTSLLDMETNGNAILREFRNKYFDVQYKLPTSVIKECVTNNDTYLWGKVCSKKNFMTNTPIDMPKVYGYGF